MLRGRVWVHCAVAGVLTNGVLLMAAHVAMVHTPAAPIALIQTLNPLMTAVLAVPLLGERLRPLQWLGLLLGLAGVVLILGLAALHSRTQLNGLLLTTGGVMGLVAGTLYFGRFCRGVPLLEGTTVQFIACAVVCLLCMESSRPRMPTGRPARWRRWRGTPRSCLWAAWCCTSPC